MTQPRWLRNVRPYGAPAEDLLIENGRFSQRRPASTTELLVTDIDGQNQLLTPALVESHVHLDKTLWGQPWRPNSAGPTLKDYIANERRILREVTVPIAQLDFVFKLASEFDRGVDIHLHDKGELGLWQIALIADYTQRFGLQDRVMISHAYCLGMLPWSQVKPVAERLAILGISLMSSAPADCAVPPFLALREVGVNVCLGSDGIRDAWSPMGNGDMLERAMLLAFRFDLNKDEELAAAFEAATVNGARALGHDGVGLEIGQPANFLLMPVQTLGEAVVSRPPREVYRGGQLIASGGRLLESRL